MFFFRWCHGELSGCASCHGAFAPPVRSVCNCHFMSYNFPFALSQGCGVLCLVTQSCPVLCDLMDCSPPGSFCPWGFSRQASMGCHALLQGIFPTQGLNPDLPHCRWILYWLSQQRSPWILEWVTHTSPGDLPDPGIELGSSAMQVDSLPAELHGKPHVHTIL